MLVYTEQAHKFLAKHMTSMTTILVPAPIDTQLFINESGHEFYQNNTLKILFNARYSPYKRHQDLFLAVSKLLKSGYKIKVTCISRDNKNLDDIVKLSHKTGVREFVEFRNAGELEEMPALYRAHDLLILPSYNEAIGMVIPEAMSCGRATITSDTVGANVYVKDGVTGLIFKTFDINELTETIERCCDADLLREMGNMARQHIVENFSADRAVLALENVIGDANQ